MSFNLPDHVDLIKDIEFPRYSNKESKTPIKSSFLTEMNRIKNGYYRSFTSEVRKYSKETNEKLYTSAKDQSPCYIPGLRTTGETKKDYQESDRTPLMVFDVDDLNEDPDLNKEILKTFQWVVAVGKSIGGKYLFVIAKYNPLKRDESYNGIKEILKEKGITIAESQHNINRLRYVSDDPDLYFNPDPLSVPDAPTIEKSELKTNHKKSVISNQDFDSIYKKIIDIRLKKEGVKFWANGTRSNSLLYINTWANRVGIPLDDCLQLAEEHCRPLMEDGQTFDIESEVRNVYRQYSSEHNSEQWVDVKQTSNGKFWSVKLVGESLKITIHHSLILQFLVSKGISLYFLDRTKKSYIYVRVIDSLVEEITEVNIAQILKDFILQQPDEFDGVTRGNLYETFCRGINAYLSKKLLCLLPPVKLDFLKDTKEESFFPFKNGVIKITPGESGNVELISYENLKKVIWKNKVNDFEIEILKDLNLIETGEYFRFVRNVNGQDDKRFYYAITIIGYLLHRYKDPSRPWAIVIAEETENEDEGGGTGKGLFMIAIGKLRIKVTMEGQTDHGDKSFRFQRVNPDTDIICVEDCKKDFDFDSYYSPITEGITVEKKGMDEYYISYEDSPKIAFTTNYTISNTGEHAQRRQRVLEFSNYYSKTRTPEMEFGHLLFNDWDKNEWNLFFNFMFYCTGIYMADSITKLDNSLSIRRKQLRLDVKGNGEEFLEWWDDYTSEKRVVVTKDEDGNEVETTEENEPDCKEFKSINELHVQFLKEYKIDEKYFKIKKFSLSIEKGCRLFGYKFEKGRGERGKGSKTEIKCVKLT